MKFNALAILSTILLAACSDAPESAGANATPPIEAAAEINAPAGEYRTDPAHATLVFRILHMGLSHYTAGFSDFSATLYFDPAAPETMNVSAVINVRSLTIPNPPEGFHDTLLGPDWLKAADYPNITFTSTRVTRTGARTANVEGELTLLGVTAPVTMEAEFVGGYPGFHPHDPQARIGFSAHGILHRADFGMTQYLPTNESPGALSNEIEFRIDAEFLGPPTPPEITEAP
ncbi:YceI family protein [Marinicaulis aureus]|uniref:YceI family protein n=1 Tax=Hyphococcus aureus TaxID=2666033 RepID=A0ABW1KTS5_9PROT